MDELARLMPPDDIDLDDEEIYTGQGLTMGEIIESQEYGSWADLDIGDSAEFVSNMRRPLRSLLNK